MLDGDIVIGGGGGADGFHALKAGEVVEEVLLDGLADPGGICVLVYGVERGEINSDLLRVGGGGDQQEGGGKNMESHGMSPDGRRL